MKEFIKGANPYMPLWEHVPDGEPRVFEYKGEKRVYVYGSHDIEKTEYCGRNQVVWSAPVNDLTNWKYHGICYEASDKSILFAPDVVQKGDTFYMYAAEDRGSRVMVASSKNPAGPFTNPVKTDLGFDPGILVDDDGRVYAYWGFCKQYCAELNDDMATIKEGTFHENVIKHCNASWAPDDGMYDEEDSFFEASSPRKVNGKYVYIYSKRYYKACPEYGVPAGGCNGFLSYKYSDSPLDGYKMGGDISFNGGELLPNADGSKTMTYRWGNNHGSIMQIEGQWYVFYHRQTGIDEFSRQAMLEPVDVAQDKNGKIYIGKITYKDGEPVSSKPVEMTSQGAHINGLDARKIISAGYACHIFGGAKGGSNGGQGGAYIKAVYEQSDEVSAPIVDISNALTVGFRYLQFGTLTPKSVCGKLTAKEDLKLNVRVDDYKGKIVASCNIKKGASSFTIPVISGLIGKRAIYFEFLSDSKGLIADFDCFWFE